MPSRARTGATRWVLLTPKGRELLGDEENEFNAKLDALIETMGRKDIEELIAIVERLTEVLDSPQFAE